MQIPNADAFRNKTVDYDNLFSKAIEGCLGEKTLTAEDFAENRVWFELPHGAEAQPSESILGELDIAGYVLEEYGKQPRQRSRSKWLIKLKPVERPIEREDDSDDRSVAPDTRRSEG